ncbi:uncharacterized protein LOC142767788 [Rhipicephalus microplus]|uniref:uncharacterized protein LOC142767788 n=1 Tax=Rhipicephalus microplus TaxID=6941 RepID=UPI003F6CEB85
MLNLKVPDRVVATLRLLEFWQADSEHCFLSVEPLFLRYQLKLEAVRYDHVVGALPPAVIAIVRDIMRAPPPDNSYDTRKEKLIRRTTESNQSGQQQLRTSEELGDQTPMEFVRRMRDVIEDHSAAFDTSFLRKLFIQRLPQQVQMILKLSS